MNKLVLLVFNLNLKKNWSIKFFKSSTTLDLNLLLEDLKNVVQFDKLNLVDQIN